MYVFRRFLIRDLQATGASVVTLGGNGDGYEKRVRELDVPYISVPVSHRGLNPAVDFVLLLALTRQLLRIKPSLVHFFTIKPVIYGSLAAWLARVPVRVATVTGLGHVFTTSPRWIRLIVCQLYKISLSRLNLVYFQNESDRSLFVQLRLVDHAKTKLISGSGVDTDAFNPNAACKPGERSSLVFLMVARLLREKGIAEYFSAASVVKAQFPNSRFQLLGGVDPRNPTSFTTEEMRELTKNSTVEWLGSTEDVRPFLENADVVVLPSYREGTPKSLLEAAAMGRAMVATDVPGCNEIVSEGETGYLCGPKDAQSLTAALLRCCQNPQKLAEFGLAARRRALERFSVKLVDSILISDYQGLLKSIPQQIRRKR